MEELLPQIQEWLTGGSPVALATVIKTWGSSPRPVGAGMAVTIDNRIAGSVSGGCVEGAVVETALSVLNTGNPARLHFGVADEQAWEVGLSCGGEIEVLIRIFGQTQLNNWKKKFDDNQPFCSAMVIEEGSLQGQEILILEDASWVGDDLPSTIMEQVLSGGVEIIKEGLLRPSKSGEKNSPEMFYHLVQPKPTLILVGGVHIAIPLFQLAEIIGFDVIIIDPRRLFGSEERFPGVKQLITEWPHNAFKKIQVTKSTAVVMLTHDPKIDDPALMIVLDSPAFYIGALGSQKTHQKRVERLVDAGVDKQKLSAIHAPVGLDLGGRSPGDIALSIMAEVVQAWNKN